MYPYPCSAIQACPTSHISAIEVLMSPHLLQAGERSLAEALLASASSSGHKSSDAIAWGPSAEDTVLGVSDADASVRSEDSAGLSAKVGHPPVIITKSCSSHGPYLDCS